MSIVLTVAQVLVGGVGALIAVVGKTWESSETGEVLPKPSSSRWGRALGAGRKHLGVRGKPTRLGWVAIACIGIAAVLGAADKISDENDKTSLKSNLAARDRDLTEKQNRILGQTERIAGLEKRLRSSLAEAKEERIALEARAGKQRLELSNKLAASERRSAILENNITAAIEAATTGTPREVDHPHFSNYPGREIPLEDQVSSQRKRITVESQATYKPLRVQPADVVKYFVPHDRQRKALAKEGLVHLVVGSSRYAIRPDNRGHGEIRVSGTAGETLPVSVELPELLELSMKMTIVSSYREDLIRLVRDALQRAGGGKPEPPRRGVKK